MRYQLAALATILALGSAAALHADPIPYANPGTVAPTVVTYATGTTINAYYYSTSAADYDTISIYDLSNGTYFSPQNALPNQSSFPGQEQTFVNNSASVDDQIVFELYNSSVGETFASDPSLSSDGINHAYVTSFSGTIPGSSVTVAGTYVGMEDLPLQGSDLDYNDDTFVFTGVTAPTPEPGSFILLGTGLLGAAGALRRRFTR